MRCQRRKMAAIILITLHKAQKLFFTPWIPNLSKDAKREDEVECLAQCHTSWDWTLGLSNSRTEFSRVRGARKRIRQEQPLSRKDGIQLQVKLNAPRAEPAKCQPAAKMAVRDLFSCEAYLIGSSPSSMTSSKSATFLELQVPHQEQICFKGLVWGLKEKTGAVLWTQCWYMAIQQLKWARANIIHTMFLRPAGAWYRIKKKYTKMQGTLLQDWVSGGAEEFEGSRKTFKKYFPHHLPMA